MRVFASIVVAVLAVVGLTSPAFAGYTAGTNLNGVHISNIGSPGANAGDSFSLTAGSFAEWTADTPADVQIPPAVLLAFGYSLSGTIISVDPSGTNATYTGTYEIYYNTDGNYTRNPADLRVSSGTFTGEGLFTPMLNSGGIHGELHQLLGPEKPWIPDISYNGNIIPVRIFEAGIPFVDALTQMQTWFRQDAFLVPEPGSSTLLAVGVLSLGACAAKRRRR
jgi:hypothetical protein